MKVFFIPLSFLIFSSASSQNLVKNGGLEVLDTTGFKPSNEYNNEHVSGIQIAPNWITATPATPDFFNSRKSGDTASNSLVLALKGEGRIGIIGGSCRLLFGSTKYKEYILGELTQPLEKGMSYEVSYFIAHDPRSSVAIDNFGALLSDSIILYQEQRKLPYQPSLIFDPEKMITFQQGWVKLSDIYTAKGGEKYIIIGSFSDKSCMPLYNLGLETVKVPADQRIVYNGYYYVDEISVVKSDFSKAKNTDEGLVSLKPRADRYLLMVDVSKSMAEEGKLDLLKSTVINVISDLPEESEIGIIAYNSKARLLLPFSGTTNKSAIKSSIDSLIAGGSTDFTGAAQFAYNYLGKGNVTDNGKNLLIVFTDGVFSVESTIQRLVKTSYKEKGIGFSVMQFGDKKNGDLMRMVLTAKGDYAEEANRNFEQKFESVIYEKKVSSNEFIPIILSGSEEDKKNEALQKAEEDKKQKEKRKSRKKVELIAGSVLGGAMIAFYFLFNR